MILIIVGIILVIIGAVEYVIYDDLLTEMSRYKYQLANC